MKTVFKSSEIAHLWAHQLAPEGRCPSSMSFNGPSFYSYGTEIARLCEHKGKKYVLLNLTGYSITTSGHQSSVRCAIPQDWTRFYIGGLSRGSTLADFAGVYCKKPGKALFEYEIELATQAKSRADSANRRNQPKHLASMAGHLETAKAIAEFFGLRNKVDTKAIDRHAAKIAAERKRQEREAKERQARYEAEQAETVAKWIAGELVQFPYGVQTVYLRQFGSSNGSPAEMVQTSRGAEIPVADAERAFRFAIAKRAKGWHRNGEQFAVGNYQLDAINEFGVVAGCHRISWAEIERFAAVMGWTEGRIYAS